jgi:hypothetical protein
MFTRIRVKLTPVCVVATLCVCENMTFRVEINLVRVEITFLPVKTTLRLEITLEHIEITLERVVSTLVCVCVKITLCL